MERRIAVLALLKTAKGGVITDERVVDWLS